ncbi:ribulose-phosphate 3-epimerase [Acidobacteriota bacterium]
MIQIAPSILSADFSKIEQAVKMIEDAGADLIHIDVMDGHFVPNLTFGPQLVASIKDKTSLPLDVHLMVNNPCTFIPLFDKAGADWISIHLEASVHLHKDIHLIKELNKKAGLAINPATPIHLMNDIIKDLDYILIMTVNPGWGGQKFIDSSYTKIAHLKNWLKGQKINTPIEVDGGIKLDNMENLVKNGADIIVSGSTIFKNQNPSEVVSQMKQIAKQYTQP